MGNFYTNITLRQVDADAVAAEMARLDRESYVFAGDSLCVVYDKQTESQETSVLAALGEHLATKFNTVAFAVLDHDDDILWFQVYHGSELVTEYCNQGGPRTNVRKLVEALGGSALRVWWLLKRPYIAQIYRHAALSKVFGFPKACLLGYEYIHRGERMDDMNESMLRHITRDGPV